MRSPRQPRGLIYVHNKKRLVKPCRMAKVLTKLHPVGSGGEYGTHASRKTHINCWEASKKKEEQKQANKSSRLPKLLDMSLLFTSISTDQSENPTSYIAARPTKSETRKDENCQDNRQHHDDHVQVERLALLTNLLARRHTRGIMYTKKAKRHTDKRRDCQA